MMDMDMNPEDHDIQAAHRGGSTRDEAANGNSEQIEVEQVGNPTLPEQRGLKADNEKVSKHT
eukprot:1654298-Prymnesium_polylepis.1